MSDSPPAAKKASRKTAATAQQPPQPRPSDEPATSSAPVPSAPTSPSPTPTAQPVDQSPPVRHPNSDSSSSSSSSPPSPPSPPSPAPLDLASYDTNYRVHGFLVVLILSFATRLYMISEPHYIIFDEVHFGKFASQYLRGTYFFDVHPPLGKLLLALVGFLTGNDGSYLFESLGADYLVDNVPYVPMRTYCAILGALLAPAAFISLSAFQYSTTTATLAGLLVVLDNSLLTQSRYILLDSMLLFFTLGAFMSMAKFISYRDRPFTLSWTLWLAACGGFLGLAVSIKYVGLFIIAVVGLYTAYDLWGILGDLRLPLSSFGKHFVFRALLLIALPLVIYTSAFAVHFAVLTKSGPGDAFMSLAFQSTLEGNPIQTLTRNHPREITFGSYVTIKSAQHHCYLHSHAVKYPLTYPDGRVSSAQQQVTCYPHKDANNWWMVLHADDSLDAVYRTPIYIQHNDRIKLVHVATNTTLNTHDVASTITAALQEVSAHNPASDTARAHPEFKLDTGYSLGGYLGFSNPRTWNTLLDFKLVHEHTHCTIQTLGQSLPDWAYSQFEVTSTLHPASGQYWVVEEVQKSTAPVVSDNSAPRQSFLMRLIELHLAMFAANARLTDEHGYQSRPIDWPLLRRGISFWQGDSRQVYLIGNPILWWAGCVCIALLVLVDVLLTLRERRNIHDLTPESRFRFAVAGRLLLAAWAFHYLPFFAMGRQLFLHHYLPALMFKIILSAVVLEHGFELLFLVVASLARIASKPSTSDRRARSSLAIVFANMFWCSAVVFVSVAAHYFILLTPLSYGAFQKGSDAEKLKFRSTWDLMVANNVRGVV